MYLITSFIPAPATCQAPCPCLGQGTECGWQERLRNQWLLILTSGRRRKCTCATARKAQLTKPSSNRRKSLRCCFEDLRKKKYELFKNCLRGKKGIEVEWPLWYSETTSGSDDITKIDKYHWKRRVQYMCV